MRYHMAMKLGMCGFTIGAAAYMKQFQVVEVQQTFYDPAANYTDDELRQIIAWLPDDPAVEAYVLFNNIPRVKDVRRFRELLPGQSLVYRTTRLNTE